MNAPRPEDVPFTISCIECDADSPETYDQAVADGWTQIQFYPQGASENYLGLCPVCRAEEERIEALLRQSFDSTSNEGRLVMPYLKLFHGRERPDEPLDDWGEPGPIFGPYPFFHTTYQSDIKFDDDRGVLRIVGDLVYYDGMFYGDWSVFDGPVSDEDAHRHMLFDSDKAVVPEKFRLCGCMKPGYFHCGVPGVLAHLENGRIPPDTKVERCDQCDRYPSDDAARAVLLEQGLLAEQSPQLFNVHCYATVRVKFCEVMASTPLDAARIGMAMFNWDEDRHEAEFDDEFTEFLVDIVGEPDFSSSKRFNADLEEIDT